MEVVMGLFDFSFASFIANEILNEEKKTDNWNKLFDELQDIESDMSLFLANMGVADTCVILDPDVIDLGKTGLDMTRQRMNNIKSKVREYISLGGDPWDIKNYEDMDFYLDELRDNLEKYKWRDYCEDGSEYGLDPKDFETEKEYNDALEEEKYGWRLYCEEGWEYDIDPDDYETEEEYVEALNAVKNGNEYTMEFILQEGKRYGISPNDFYYESQFIEEVKNIHNDDIPVDWSYSMKIARNYDIWTYEFITKEDYFEAVVEARKVEEEEFR